MGYVVFLQILYQKLNKFFPALTDATVWTSFWKGFFKSSFWLKYSRKCTFAFLSNLQNSINWYLQLADTFHRNISAATHTCVLTLTYLSVFSTSTASNDHEKRIPGRDAPSTHCRRLHPHNSSHSLPFIRPDELQTGRGPASWSSWHFSGLGHPRS